MRSVLGPPPWANSFVPPPEPPRIFAMRPDDRVGGDAQLDGSLCPRSM